VFDELFGEDMIGIGGLEKKIGLCQIFSAFGKKFEFSLKFIKSLGLISVKKR
jgi:hypothetical protein